MTIAIGMPLFLFPKICMLFTANLHKKRKESCFWKSPNGGEPVKDSYKKKAKNYVKQSEQSRKISSV